MDKSVAAEHPPGAVRGDSWMWSTCTVCGVSSSATQNNAALRLEQRGAFCFCVCLFVCLSVCLFVCLFVGLLLKSGGSCLGRCFLKRWDPFFFIVGKPCGEKIGPTVVTLEEPKRDNLWRFSCCSKWTEKPQDCWWRILSAIGNEKACNCLSWKLASSNQYFFQGSWS